ncbi:MAG: hypothetical protein HC888_04745 [Candidatus Competibacteraceae bacterium]|nr:hypothetical protein [Candidatus Competibacteraceae bacterium]
MHHINGQIVGSGEIDWQCGEFYNRTYKVDAARISIHFITLYRKLSDQELLKRYAETLSRNKIDWIEKSGNSWQIDPFGLRAIYPELPDSLLRGGKVKVAPEIDTKENQHIGGKTFTQSVSMYLDPEEVLTTMATQDEVPAEIRESIERLQKDTSQFSKKAFIIMGFGSTTAHRQVVEAIRAKLQEFRIQGLRADDKQYHDDLYYNILTYMHGCDFGISVFERVESDDFNPNVSLEVGFMLGLKKEVCFLKDKTLRKLQTDLVGKLYREFDTLNVEATVSRELDKWLRDKNLV